MRVKEARLCQHEVSVIHKRAKSCESEISKPAAKISSERKKLLHAIDANREVRISALLPGIAKNPPARWKPYLGGRPREQDVERMLRSELTDAFGYSDDVFQDMSVKAVFKGVTYESLSDPEFMRIARDAIPLLDTLHEEFDVAKAEERRDGSTTPS